jgi:menaquinone-9 beta-reductase
MDSEVIVVGGSITGATVALHLARAGRDVMLLERTVQQRRKACGEGLFPAGVRELDLLGALPELAPRGRELHAISISAGEHTATAPLSGWGVPAMGIQRTELDAALLRAAERGGVRLRRGVTSRGLVSEGGAITGVITDHGDVHARVVVAADGAQSRLRRDAGLASGRPGGRYGVSAHLRLDGGLEPAVRVRAEAGYEIYLTPVGRDVANVALLVGRERARRFGGRVREEYTALLSRHPALAGRCELLDEPVAAGPFPVRCSRPWRDGLVLAGDAAGFYDGISGEGMTLALRSARACAQAVDAHLRDGHAAALEAYERRLRALARNPELLARLSLTLARRPALAAAAIRNLERRPATFAKLVEINSGQRPLSALRPSDVLAMLAGV